MCLCVWFFYLLDEIMFLLKCDEDESYCMVNDEDVIFDYETVKKGETVQFYYNKKQYTGDVIMFSGSFFLFLYSVSNLITSILIPGLTFKI